MLNPDGVPCTPSVSFPAGDTVLAPVPQDLDRERHMRPLTLHSILATTDLADDDIPALRTAAVLARLASAQLHVVHAGPANDDDRARALERQLRTADPDSAILPAITIRSGRTDRVIVDAAQMVDADVIVLGPHRPDASRPKTGTAYRVAAAAERPCLVLPGEMSLPLGRVLVPIDASETARGALAVALTWASALRRRSLDAGEATTLVVLHVERSTGGRPPAAQALMEDAMQQVNERVAGIAGVHVERVGLESDDTAAAIVKYAAEGGHDLIALGTRARIGDGTELGSVSSAVVQDASRPILLVPPRIWREHGRDPLP